MMKLMRTTLHDYKDLVWPGMGKVQWKHLADLHALQEQHGFRLGNKLSHNHIFYQRCKMKVKYAIQAIASDSTARSLRWLHEEKAAGFESEDVLATAAFVEVLDKLFDIMNSRFKFAPGHKVALAVSNKAKAEEVFDKAEDMLSSLQDNSGKLLIETKRRTGPLGLLADIKTVRGLLHNMETGAFPLSYLATYKFSQDHLEVFFSAIRMKNGWSINPTPTQFRTAYRSLTLHAGKRISGSSAANCLPQDETSVVTLQSASLQGTEEADGEDEDGDKPEFEEAEADVLFTGCGKIEDCLMCSSSLTYIGGYISFLLLSIVQCQVCRGALIHSEGDPCINGTLISKKNYVGERAGVKTGLMYPSGSVCRIVYTAEKLLRYHVQVSLDDPKLRDKILYVCLKNVKSLLPFPSLKSHDLNTCDGIYCHSIALCHLILLKFINLRINKVVKDSVQQSRGKGHSMHRAKIFANL